MTGSDDRDPRITEIMERHTPAHDGEPDWGRVTGRRRRKRHTVRPMLAAAGVAAAVIAMIAGVVAAPDDDDHRVTAPLGFADQTDEGVALRLRVPQRGDASAQEAARWAARALNARAEAQGFAVLTDPRSDGTLDLWVPVARSSGEISEFLQPVDAAMYDGGARRVARGTDLRTVLDAGEAIAPRGPGATLYLVDRRGNPAQGPARDVASLRAMLGVKGPIPEAFTIRHVPAGYTLIANPGWTRFQILRDDPLIPGAEIASVSKVRGSDTDLALTLTARGRALWGSTPRTGEPVNLVLFQEVGLPTAYATVDAERSSAARVVLTTRDTRSAEFVAGVLAGGTLPGRPEVIDEQPTGRERTMTGGDWGDIPPVIADYLRRSTSGVSADSLRRQVAIAGPDGEWSIWVDRGPEGDERGMVVEMLVDPRNGGLQVGEGRGGCQLTPAQPLVRICGSGPGYAFGRVSERVERVSGAGRTAVGNGWFLAVDDGASMNAAPLERIVGHAADGRELATVSVPG